MERFIIETVGADAEVESAGIGWLADKALAVGEEAAIVVPDVPSIENLGRALGRQIADVARRDRRFVLDGATISVLTLTALPGSFRGPVLVPWANTKMAEEAEGLRPYAVCATSWGPGDLDEWKQTWNPIDLRSGTAGGAEESEVGLEKAIVESLTSPSGASDVLHPSDKKRAVNSLKALRALGISFDPGKVRRIALRRGWTPDAADRLMAFAQKIGEGRVVRGGDALNKTQAKQIVARLEGLEQEMTRASD